ncbi:MAG: hypothetical protein ACRECW_02420 [Phyllobacterium sp.]
MLARPDKFLCVECGLPYGAVAFHHYEDNIDNGAAYWCDRGVPCSPQCSLQHFLTRRAEGTLPASPAPNPMEHVDF